MQRIDAHNHFWKFNPVAHSWINDEMSFIQRDFLPNDFEPILREHGFDGSVVVQVDQHDAENDFLINLTKDNEFVKGIVGWVDLQNENVSERLAYWQSHDKIKGFRHILQGEPDRAMMLTPAFKNGISLLSRYNFTYDIVIFPDQLTYVPELLESFPKQRFIIDHIAKPLIRQGEIAEWKKDIQAVAEHENVFVKISGLVTEANWQHWEPNDFTPYIDVIVESFGTKRIVYGSDWPVCLVAASYNRMYEIVNDYFKTFSQNEQDLFFGVNAINFYNL